MQETGRRKHTKCTGTVKPAKRKVMRSGSTNCDIEVPDFKPKEAKTPTFKQRLKFGSNIQVAKTIALFPKQQI